MVVRMVSGGVNVSNVISLLGVFLLRPQTELRIAWGRHAGRFATAGGAGPMSSPTGFA